MRGTDDIAEDRLKQGDEKRVEDHAAGGLSELRTPELFLISAVRLWCGPDGSVPCRHVLTRNGFQAAGLRQTDYESFARLMNTFLVSAHRPLRVAPSSCSALLRDEAWMLEIVALCQDGRLQDAATLMGAWLPPAAVRLAVGIAADFADGLATVGLLLDARTVAQKPRVLH